MAAPPIERTSVRDYRDELLSFSRFLASLGNTSYPPVFAEYAHALERAGSLTEVRAVQKKARRHLKGTLGTINDGPPSDSTSGLCVFSGTQEIMYLEHEAHMEKFRANARRLFWP